MPQDEPIAHQTDRPQPAHGADGKFITTVEVAERDAEAARLWSQGLSHRQIAIRLGFSSHRGAAAAVDRGLTSARRIDTEAREAAKLRLAQIRQTAADMETKAREIADRVHYAHSNGDVVYLHGEPMEDDGPALQAIDRVLAASKLTLAADEREAKLLGLDAETKVQVSGGLVYEVVGVDPSELTGMPPSDG